MFLLVRSAFFAGFLRFSSPPGVTLGEVRKDRLPAMRGTSIKYQL